ncbi:hypothetical protein V8G54_023980 [Vigna mungo]|uniref:Uncharacterized protein n=1 Tax=Vigna mungo TaxID=3915 RepID=A0AAQ3RPP8_VIGMU
MHPQFTLDLRNMRLSLATDRFNPYGNLSTSYNIWPIVLIPYNFPPWICMKQSSFIIPMVILGKLAPTNDIDVYLQSLIQELKKLWNIVIKKFYSYGNEVFHMYNVHVEFGKEPIVEERTKRQRRFYHPGYTFYNSERNISFFSFFIG